MPLGANKAAIMGVAGVSTGDVVLLSTQTADNDATVSFTSGINATYGEYVFKFYNINAATHQAQFSIQANASAQSGYNETIQSAVFRGYHNEDDSSSLLTNLTSADQAQGTAFQQIAYSLGNDADEQVSGELHLFNPSSTASVTYFNSRTSASGYEPAAIDFFVGGHINTTSAITDIQFKMSSGNFDGKIKLWGVK